MVEVGPGDLHPCLYLYRGAMVTCNLHTDSWYSCLRRNCERLAAGKYPYEQDEQKVKKCSLIGCYYAHNIIPYQETGPVCL